MSALSDGMAKLQADIAVLRGSTLANLPAALSALEADAAQLAALINAVVKAVTSGGDPGVTDAAQPMVVNP